jgi:hypothetical protein
VDWIVTDVTFRVTDVLNNVNAPDLAVGQTLTMTIDGGELVMNARR